MNPDLKGISDNMLHLGLGALSHANRHAAYAPMENQAWPELSILQAAHAAELIIKARIAQEHPLLIFDRLPRASQASGTHLVFDDLVKQGRTLQWQDLPERLWAATGIQIPNLSHFEEFGRLRNGIQHLGPIDGLDAGGETLNFVFKVIDPFIHDCWGLYAIDFDEDYEPYLYFVTTLVGREIEFLVSPDAASVFKEWQVDWNSVSEDYRNLMFDRVEKATSDMEEPPGGLGERPIEGNGQA